MLADHVAAGFDPAAFWGLTPRLYLLQMEAAARRAAARQESAMALAWMTAALSRSRKMPPLKRFLREDTGGRDIAMRMAALRARIPTITMDEWRARHE